MSKVALFYKVWYKYSGGTMKTPGEIEKTEWLKCSDIRPFIGQPRTVFNDEKLASLKESIKLIGQRIAIHVMKLPERSSKFELIDGERRLRACTELGLPIMAVIHDHIKDRNKQFLEAVLYNEDQDGLTDLERMRAFRKIGADYNFSIRKIAKLLNKSVEWVRQYWNLGDLDPEVQEMMSPDQPKDNHLSFSRARLLSILPRQDQVKSAKEVIEKKLTIKETSDLVKKSDFSGKISALKEFRYFLRNTSNGSEIVLNKKRTYFDEILKPLSDKDIAGMLSEVREIINNMTAIKESLNRSYQIKLKRVG
jgi:ParB/RepB/Spo0J family partition protein